MYLSVTQQLLDYYGIILIMKSINHTSKILKIKLLLRNISLEKIKLSIQSMKDVKILKIFNKKELLDEELWDNRELGATEEFVRRSSPEREKALNDSLNLLNKKNNKINKL